MKQPQQEQDKIESSLSKNKQRIEELLLDCDDIIRQPMKLGGETKVECLLVFIEVAVSNMILQDSVIGQTFMQMMNESPQKIIEQAKENGLGIADIKELKTMKEATAALLAGNAILFIDGYDKALKISSKGYPGLGVQQAESEKVIRGSNEGFSDAVKVNAALIRKRVRDTKVKVKEKRMGERSDTVVYLVYIDDLVDPGILSQIESGLESFKIDGILDSGVIEQLTENSWRSPFPQYQTTERPDRAAMAILDGRIALLSDNSPVCLLLPTTYNCFLQTTDDYFNRWEIASFTRLLRYFASFLALAMPGLYLAVTTFHAQIIPTNLLLSFQAAREGVPFPAVIEVLIMELAFELLREAGVRLPGPMGSTIGIVGGLIVGQAAVEANLVSPIVVIIVALTALCSFAIPNEEFATASRLIKFFLIFFCAFMGLYGFVLGMFFVFFHLAQLESFGIPYLMPFSAADMNGYEDEKDTIIRRPLFGLKRRPYFAKKDQRTRLRFKKEDKE
ncbi:spore germination protein [Anaerosacchariphilus polymeriproducens]|uniref:Spore germination protein n=1 Tax=Anaerosacchariphilus polymeriproducens TaxID=1812858 RepID=A0A371AV68_9FIRM|nr:spore germination protein [Anaerosacchariphilus polymeriproducens]RDU23468.1 spore germination protein [Anaerosacchariphilus polymeriproducens]